MFFDEENSVKILSVLNLSWNQTEATVAPRPFHALSFRLEGDSRFSDDTHEVTVGDNGILFMPAGASYHLTSGKEQLICVHFQLEKENEALQFRGYEPVNPLVFRDLFTSLFDIWQKKKPGYGFRALSVFYHIIEQMERQFYRQDTNASYRRIAPAVEYMHTHLCDPLLSVECLTQIAGLSDTCFRRLFCETFGSTPNHYINSLRIEQAAEKLNSGLYTVEQAAAESGFFDAKYFSTVFKRFKGSPPSRYKGRRND